MGVSEMCHFDIYIYRDQYSYPRHGPWPQELEKRTLHTLSGSGKAYETRHRAHGDVVCR